MLHTAGPGVDTAAEHSVSPSQNCTASHHERMPDFLAQSCVQDANIGASASVVAFSSHCRTSARRLSTVRVSREVNGIDILEIDFGSCKMVDVCSSHNC